MKKLISIFLSMLLLVSSSGMAYARHLCGGMEINAEITFGEKHLSCGMDKEVENSSDCCGDSEVFEENHCCENLIAKVQTDDNFTKASSDLEASKIFNAISAQIFVLDVSKIIAPKTISFAEYNPPPLLQDLNILYETYLL